ncbi:hypothetical protein DFH09DRAFT_1374992 [Mycena vulgaris]|nr:hypothetical protein DFH09DRAFT_1374992 [Mycena vulgaris]
MVQVTVRVTSSSSLLAGSRVPGEDGARGMLVSIRGILVSSSRFARIWMDPKSIRLRRRDILSTHMTSPTMDAEEEGEGRSAAVRIYLTLDLDDAVRCWARGRGATFSHRKYVPLFLARVPRTCADAVFLQTSTSRHPLKLPDGRKLQAPWTPTHDVRLDASARTLTFPLFVAEISISATPTRNGPPGIDAISLDGRYVVPLYARARVPTVAAPSTCTQWNLCLISERL